MVRDKETGVELEVDNQYIMSPKDLKTIHFMNKMMDAGVRIQIAVLAGRVCTYGGGVL